MLLDYLALVLLLLNIIVVFYTFIYIHDLPHKVATRFAAGATLEHGGQTYFFIDGNTKREFARQKGTA